MAAQDASTVQHSTMGDADRLAAGNGRPYLRDDMGIGSGDKVIFGLIIDFICRLFLVGLAIVVYGFVITIIVLAIGEKNNWW